MSKLQAALRAFHRALQFGSRRQAPSFGIPSTLDGYTALAVLESSLADSCVTHGQTAFARSWQEELEREKQNLFDRPLSIMPVESARSAFAAAMGMAMAGTRLSMQVSSKDLMAVQDQLALAAAQHLPLVCIVSCSSDGHRALHASAQSGWLQLYASNVQEAVDLAIIARRVAETALLPVMLAVDARQTAESIQDLHLPPPDFLRAFLGASDESIPCPDPGQAMLFGSRRRRLPRWYSLDRPGLNAAAQPDGVSGLGQVGQQPFFGGQVQELLAEVCAEYSQQSARLLEAFSQYRSEDAETLMVAMGSAVECAEQVADELRSKHHKKIGVLGVRSLQPFPAEAISDQLRGKRDVIVLDRCDAGAQRETQLATWIRTAASQRLDSGRARKDSSWSPWSLPRVRNLVYGLGGLPLSAADLSLACRQDPHEAPPLQYLGVDFSFGDSSFPKRRVLFETLSRSYPDLASLGIKSSAVSSAGRRTWSLAILRSPQQDTSCAQTAAQVLRSQLEGRLRSRIGVRLSSMTSMDWLQFGEADMRDPGDLIEPDIVLAMDADLL
ncbi:MAG: hypothetical protein ACYTG5_19470, partial [Planctomycetota bacterium]